MAEAAKPLVLLTLGRSVCKYENLLSHVEMDLDREHRVMILCAVIAGMIAFVGQVLTAMATLLAALLTVFVAILVALSS
jgi:hypothetical protein